MAVDRKAALRRFFLIVAGVRFARTPTGYEPVEVLLLQPAIQLPLYRIFDTYTNLDDLKFFEHFLKKSDSTFCFALI
ncbi:MAG: hypothetical protein UY47_C0010G0011 [Parcubacteria group bacterium GW2011_GWB1_49_7]|nr:MAG: hypothetical protein UY47_C0010G0011 [Parcubacteria group bacterium GW2011_GWB1_49_7]